MKNLLFHVFIILMLAFISCAEDSGTDFPDPGGTASSGAPGDNYLSPEIGSAPQSEATSHIVPVGFLFNSCIQLMSPSQETDNSNTVFVLDTNSNNRLMFYQNSNTVKTIELLDSGTDFPNPSTFSCSTSSLWSCADFSFSENGNINSVRVYQSGYVGIFSYETSVTNCNSSAIGHEVLASQNNINALKTETTFTYGTGTSSEYNLRVITYENSNASGLFKTIRFELYSGNTNYQYSATGL